MAFPNLEILPPEERRLWQALGEVPRAFVLYGGTALALPLRDALAAAAAAWGRGFNPLLSLKALSYFGDGDLPELPEETRRRLLGQGR